MIHPLWIILSNVPAMRWEGDEFCSVWLMELWGRERGQGLPGSLYS